MCSTNWPVQAWLKTFLFVWLLVTACRQAFDLIGRLWIPVLVNLVQILTCIAGIFAVYQRRAAFLIVLSIACFFSILYNIALILWYNDVFGDHNKPLLTMGLPHGYSFFVQHNPFCDSYFNVTKARWAQKAGCTINYTIFESVQAVFHIILAFSTAIFSILMAKQRWNDSLKNSKAYDSRTQLTKMHIESGAAPKPNNCRAPNSNSSTSYMNSSYDNPEPLVNPQVLTKKLAGANTKYVKRKPVEQPENYSSAPTIELNSNNTDSPPASQVEEEPKNQRLMRAIPERRSCGAQLAKILDQSTDSTGRYSKIGNASAVSHSRRRSEHLLRPSASANNASMLEEAEENPDYVEARNRIAARLANLNGEPSSSRNSPYHKRQGSAGNLTSLISFDPKSSTLIRVQEHQNDTDDESEIVEQEEPRPKTLQVCRSHSQDSSPAFPAPTLPRVFEQTSDSGHHSTNSNNSPNWSNGGISFPSHFNPNYMPITQSRELSLRLNDSKSPESLNYEQIGCRQVSTAFPVTHTRQRSYCGVSVSTAMPLAKPETNDSYYNRGYARHPPETQNSPIISTHFSKAFHDRWLSGQDQSHDDLPPPPPLTTLINTTKLPQVPSDPHIEGLLV